MKNFLLTLMCSLALIFVLSPQISQAQTSPDTTASFYKSEDLSVKPIFTGKEDNRTDSLLAYAQFIASPEVKALIVKSADQIKNTPKEGGIEAWYAWFITAATTIFGLYQYWKRAKAKQGNSDPMARKPDTV